MNGWFPLSDNFRFNFGETSSSRILVEPWDTPVSAEEAAERLRDPKSYRNSHHAIPEAMATAFKTAVEKGTKIFSEVMVNNIENDHHLETLQKAKELGEVPPFLAVRLIKMKFLPEDRANALDREFQQRAHELSRQNLDSIISSRLEYKKELLEKANMVRGAVENTVKDLWLDGPNLGNTWDRTLKVTTLVREPGPERVFVRTDVPFSTIFFKTVLTECKIKVGQKAEEIYGKLAITASNKRKAQVQRDAAIATAAALPPEAARQAIQKHQARRNNGQASNGEARRDSGNAGAPSRADNAGAHPQSAKKRNREDTENPQRAVKTHRGGHSFNAVTPGHNHEAHSATRGARTATHRGGSLSVSVAARGRGKTSTSTHPPRDGFQARGRGRGGERGGAHHWNWHNRKTKSFNSGNGN